LVGAWGLARDVILPVLRSVENASEFITLLLPSNNFCSFRQQCLRSSLGLQA
jgi:hypothetical protein